LNLLMKLIAAPLVVWLSSYMFPGLFYTSVWQPLIVGLVIAIAGRIIETVTLVRGTAWLNVLLDIAVATGIIYFSAYFFTGASIEFLAAFFTAAVIGVAEYAIHWYELKGKIAPEKNE